MGSSKRKASFRIDDILQQQQQQQQGLQRIPSYSPNKSVTSPESEIDTPVANMNPNQSQRVQQNSPEKTNKGDSLHPMNGGMVHPAATSSSVEPPYSSPSGSGGSEGGPRKPHPLYPSSGSSSFPPDMQKHAPNFYLPLSLGIPQFSPAAYLEHYANALQKGE